ncbi:MAG: 50S ribosomal protein L4 [Gemmatimonadetes bacterium]|nr:50S ribosomal protein L4 [Gemmatimonadota bacterium]
MIQALEVLAYTAEGARRPHAVRLPPDPFDGRVHAAAMHQAVRMFLANQRQGTAQTKTRGFVSGGNRKPWRQKGTGRARQGSIRAPNWPGGGTVFGPIPRDYRMGMPKRLRRLARRSALNARARERALAVIEPLAFEAPRTKRMVEIIGRMGLADRRVLVLTDRLEHNVALSARNLRNVDVMRFADASTYDILRADAVLIEEPALGTLEAGDEAPREVESPRPAPKSGPTARAREGARGAQPARKKPATRPAPAKKAPAKKATPAGKPAAKAKATAAKPAKKAAEAAPKAKKADAKKPGKKG